jgi:hypothetical protein
VALCIYEGSREVYNHNDEQLGPTQPQWYVKAATSFDRTWVIRTIAPLPNAVPQHPYTTYIIPFGWTDRQHLRGPGHGFFVMPLANLKAHWTWSQKLDPLAPGGTTVSSAPDFPKVWLQELGTDGVLAVFSIEAPSGDLDSDTLDVLVGPHRIHRTGIDPKHPDGTFSVRLFNNTSKSVSGLVLVAHFELYTTWTNEGY